MQTSQIKKHNKAEWNQRLVAVYAERYNDLVFVARRYLDTDFRSEEAVQEALLRCHQSNASPEPGREFAYLRMCVLNVARGTLRRRQIAERLAERPVLAFDPVGEWLDQHAEAIDISVAMTALSERQREVLVLRHVDVLSEAETAAQLGISAGSVKTHASRARKTLRSALQSLAAA